MNNTEKPLKKFTIKMQRNQIAEVDIEVEATSDEEAVDKATEMAENCTDGNGFMLDWDEVIELTDRPLLRLRCQLLVCGFWLGFRVRPQRWWLYYKLPAVSGSSCCMGM